VTGKGTSQLKKLISLIMLQLLTHIRHIEVKDLERRIDSRAFLVIIFLPVISEMHSP
jgi:hypothetical protein